ncbi:MAG: hypothetical protein CBD18_08455 [Opitutales bacterium TMED158]|nr:MAG: hypothetical protein CBD18_08455 [Opitutales bacterium TMED158]
MDKVEARLVLANYTLLERPENDPRFDEAWRIAESDPELMAWWERERSQDQAVQDTLLQLEPPSDLRAALSASMENAAKGKSIRRKAFRYLALAASVAIVLSLYIEFAVDRSDEYTGPLVERAFNYSFDGPRLSYFNKDTTKITDWLESQNFEVPDQLPPRFLAQEGIGCRPLNWGESQVAIICVDAEVVYHLFVARQDDYTDVEFASRPEFEPRKAGWTVSSWESEGHLFILTAKANQDRLESMLAEYTP